MTWRHFLGQRTSAKISSFATGIQGRTTTIYEMPCVIRTKWPTLLWCCWLTFWRRSVSKTNNSQTNQSTKFFGQWAFLIWHHSHLPKVRANVCMFFPSIPCSAGNSGNSKQNLITSQKSNTKKKFIQKHTHTNRRQKNHPKPHQYPLLHVDFSILDHAIHQLFPELRPSSFGQATVEKSQTCNQPIRIPWLDVSVPSYP